ncbi:MAG TPA: DUF481 domain-containing protein [Oligoflexia bacterium]|nr:DUF481 domain-containing protein [Oligoflexia bacterium]HMR24739.1 DUF481 domain-containing protein [Oligoflexia bacterium]
MKKILLSLILILGASAFAQDDEATEDASEKTAVEAATQTEVAPEVKTDDMGWKANAGLNGVSNTGNAVNQTVSGLFSVVNRTGMNKVELSGIGAYGRAQDDAGVTSTNTENWRTQLRYDRYLNDTIAIFGYGHLGQDRPAGFDWRFGGGTGFAHEVIKKEKDFLRYEIGYDYTREDRITDVLADIHSARVFGIYKRKISDWADFSQTVELLYNLEKSDDFRFNTLTGLTTKVTEKVGFQVGYAMRFDNDPVTGAENLDTQTQAGLTVNFL